MKIAAILSLMLLNGLTHAQSLELSVLNKKSEAMPYAYILVNWKPVTVSDTLGKAVIPISKLNDKDTISVSYLGAQSNWIVFDDSLKLKKKHCFYLDESGYSLNEIVVTYHDFENMLRKSFKNHPVLNYSCKLSAKFDYNLTYDKKFMTNKRNTAKHISGTLEAVNNTKFEPKRYNWFDPPIKFLTDNDTNNFHQSLSNNTHQALWFSNLSIQLWQNKNSRVKPYYSYLGEKDNFKVFRISYPKSLFQKFYYQIMLYIDKESKNLRHVEIDAYNDEPINPPVNKWQYIFKLKYDCELYTHKKPKRPPIYFPINIDYTFQTIDFSTINIRISEHKIKL